MLFHNSVFQTRDGPPLNLPHIAKGGLLLESQIFVFLKKLQGVKRCEITMLHHMFHWHFSGKGGARGKFGLVCKVKSPKVIKSACIRPVYAGCCGAAELQT